MAVYKVSSQAANTLRRQILDGSFPPGSRLPAERALSEQLGISRTALRDALQELETSGLIIVQIGRGRFVAPDVAAGRSAAAASRWLYFHRQDIEALNEVRQLLEPRAVETMPKTSIERVAMEARDIVEQQTEAILNQDYGLAARLDSEFHSLLVAETPNAPLRIMIEQLITMAEPNAYSVYKVPGAAAHSVQQHQAIVDELSAGKVQAAARLVRKHAHTATRFALSQDVDTGT